MYCLLDFKWEPTMFSSHSPVRQAAQTTLPCPDCGHPLIVERTCQEAHLRCPACGHHFPVSEFVARADEALETFLDGLYIDRI